MTRDERSHHPHPDVEPQLCEAVPSSRWCAGFTTECPEARRLLNVIEAESCAVTFRDGTLSIRSTHGATHRAVHAAAMLHHHAQEHATEVFWMVTGELPPA